MLFELSLEPKDMKKSAPSVLYYKKFTGDICGLEVDFKEEALLY